MCEGGTTTLRANLSENIQWSTGAFTQEIVVSEAGVYSFTYIDESGCTVESQEIRIDQSIPIEILSVNEGQICEGGIDMLSVSDVQSVRWSTGETTAQIEVAPEVSQVYWVEATNEAGCTYRDTLLLEVIPYFEPQAPTNLLPENGGFISQTPLEFSWSPVANADRYDFYLWKEEDQQPTTPFALDIANIRYTYVGTLDFETTYLWQIVPKNQCAIGFPSTIQSFTVLPAPDLEVSNINVPTSAFSGTSIEIEWSVSNTGAGDTRMDGWYDFLYLSEDDQLDRNDHFINAFPNIRALSPTENYSNQTTFTLPRGIEGEYYIFVRTNLGVNGLPSIQEDNFDNNQASEAFPVVLTPAPDLRVVEGVLPGTDGVMFSGTEGTVRFTIRNQGLGETESGRWKDRVILSQDSVLLNFFGSIFFPSFHSGNLKSRF